MKMKCLMIVGVLGMWGPTAFAQMQPAPQMGGELYAQAPSSEVVAEKAESRTEVLFFEPVQAQWDNDEDRSAIKKQQAKYVAAKNAKDWGEGRRVALWHFQRMWLFYNEALDIITTDDGKVKAGGWGDLTELKRAQGLLEDADQSSVKARKMNHHIDDVDDCDMKRARVRKSVEKRIADLLAE